jgi:hypothetical protein
MNAENPVQIDLFGVSATRTKDTRLAEHIGGSARGYQGDLCAVTPLSCPGDGPIDGHPAVYLYIAALEANVLNCRLARARSGGSCRAGAR